MADFYNGFTKDDLSLLLRFLFIFEDVIKPFNKDEDLFKIYPDLKESQMNFKKHRKFHLKTTKEISNMNVIKDEHFWGTSSRKTLFLSFLYHLRNAIAHNNIKVIDKTYYFEDFNSLVSTKNVRHVQIG